VRVARRIRLSVAGRSAAAATADIRIPVAPDAFLRLLPVTPERRAARVISALDLLEHKADRSRLAGAIALVGGSA
jgi:hypothetical protein